MKTRFSRGLEKWSEHTRNLPPLSLGQKVLVQNQHGAGKIAKRWDRSGTVIEDLGYNKYRIRVDGSGRVTDRNRQFLRQFSSVTLSKPGPSPPSQLSQPPPLPVSASTAPDVPAPPVSPPPPPVRVPTASDIPDIPTIPADSEDNFVTPPSSPEAAPAPSPSAEPTPPALRRTGRHLTPNKLFPSSEYDLRRRRSRQQGGGGEASQRT